MLLKCKDSILLNFGANPIPVRLVISLFKLSVISLLVRTSLTALVLIISSVYAMWRMETSRLSMMKLSCGSKRLTGLAIVDVVWIVLVTVQCWCAETRRRWWLVASRASLFFGLEVQNRNEAGWRLILDDEKLGE